MPTPSATPSQEATVILSVPTDLIKEAEWNYKLTATSQQLEKLAASIKHDKSAGVLAVRELPDDPEYDYEAIDGNHRLTVVRDVLGWATIRCENFGPISKPEAIVIARRRNHQWFEDNLVVLASLFDDFVFPEFDMPDLAAILPDTEDDLRAMQAMVQEYAWDEIGDETGTEETKDDTRYHSFTFSVQRPGYDQFLAVERVIVSQQKLQAANESILRGLILEILVATYQQRKGKADQAPTSNEAPGDDDADHLPTP